MAWKVKCWIPVEVEPEEEIIFDDKRQADLEEEHCSFLQPENNYLVVECDENGVEEE